jgi:hypothetical protein
MVRLYKLTQPQGYKIMKQTINKCDFRNAFAECNRGDQFSYEALGLLFDFLEEMEEGTGEGYDLDVIALCCEFTELTPDEIVRDYDMGKSESFDIEEWLNDRTMVAGVTESGNYVFAAF